MNLVTKTPLSPPTVALLFSQLVYRNSLGLSRVILGKAQKSLTEARLEKRRQI